MSSLEEAVQCPPGQLWYPGLCLDIEFPIATDHQLVEAWESYTGRPAHATQEIYGVYSEARSVTAVASIDLCEVVRDTSITLDDLTGAVRNRRSHYSEGTWYHRSKKGPEYEWSMVVSSVQTIMNYGLVQPVNGIERIAETLHSWRKAGVYCVANTSTLQGCEIATIKHTLGRDLPACFDAMILPRNHDGLGSVSKAAALSIFASESGIALAEVPKVHIDDNTQHIIGFMQHDPDTHLLVPSHGGNTETNTDIQCKTPTEAFERAEHFLAARGVL